tara:strand:+ start:380 stop:604 length:225 start_codon:yes stop_codon:yes gene_type:complete
MKLIGEELKEKFKVGDIVYTKPLIKDKFGAGVILKIYDAKMANKLLPAATIYLFEDKVTKDYLLEVLRIKEQEA